MSDTLQLDKRQRAMLAEMGVRVWTPIDQAEPANVPEKTSDNKKTEPPKVEATKPQTSKPESTNLKTTAYQATTEVIAPVVAKPAAFEVRTQGANQLDWPSLQKAVVNCQACSLCMSRRNTVFGKGSHISGSEPHTETQTVDWLIVGEAPGENEDAEGEPFVGQAGQLLDNMLRAMQLSRTGELSNATKPNQSIFITNVLKCRPPGNRNPAPEEVAQCMPYLERQIALLQPKIILAMGRFAAQALLRYSIDKVESIPLGKLRGQVHRLGNTPVVVTYHPAYVLRNLPEKAKLWADACLAMATLQTLQN
jgi:uracil-DNA glycosylase family 4